MLDSPRKYLSNSSTSRNFVSSIVWPPAIRRPTAALLNSCAKRRTSARSVAAPPPPPPFPSSSSFVVDRCHLPLHLLPTGRL
jgi:hypothetical protein